MAKILMILFHHIQHNLFFPNLIAYAMLHKTAMMTSPIHKSLCYPFVCFFVSSKMYIPSAPANANNAVNR
jgi:hypothetical protein